MWSRNSHTSAPLTKITSIKVKFKWNKIKQDMFKGIKRVVARGVLSTYLDLNKSFIIHIDARKFQLEEVIGWNYKPIAFYGIKLAGAKIRYIVTEK